MTSRRRSEEARTRRKRLRTVLRDYADGPWRAWTPAAKVALKARELYEDLFHLRLRLQRDSALIELVWGHGILSWAPDAPDAPTARGSSTR